MDDVIDMPEGKMNRGKILAEARRRKKELIAKGLVTEEETEEPDERADVRIRIDIPVSYGQPNPYIEISGTRYYDGLEYTVTPTMARELRYMMEQVISHDRQVKEGKSLNYARRNSLKYRNRIA